MEHLKTFAVSLACLLLVYACSAEADSATPTLEPGQDQVEEPVQEPESAPEPERTEEGPEPEPEQDQVEEPVHEPEPTSTTKLPPEPPVPLDATYVFGEQVSPRTQASVADSLAYAASFIEEVTGYKNDDFTLFAFMSSEPLVEHYMRFYNIPGGQRTEILNRWRTPRWEAGRGNIFALLMTELSGLDHATLHPITHEYVHVIQWSFAPNTQWGPDNPLPIGPYWLVEGIADYFALLHLSSRGLGIPMAQNYKNVVQVANYSDAPLHSMESWSGVEDAGQASAYALGTVAAYQLAERSGIKALLEYSEAVGNTGNWRRGFEQVFGLSVEQFYEDFEDPRDLGYASYGEDPTLDELHDGCAAGSLADCDMLLLVADSGSEYGNLAVTCGGLVEEIDSTSTCMDALQNFSEKDDLARQCEGGFFIACDAYRLLAVVGSEEQALAATCGGIRDPSDTTPCWISYGFGFR